MNRVNLIPAYRIQAKKRRLRIGTWAVACTACTLLLLAVCGVCYAVLGRDDRGLDEELRAVAGKIRASKAAIGAARLQLHSAEAELAANRAVGSQPDWSILLAWVSDKLGEDIVLRECRLGDRAARPFGRPRPSEQLPRGSPIPGPDGAEYALTLIGYGRSLPAVSQFALRLERSQLFPKVRLIRNTREPFLADNAVAFEIACSLPRP